MELKTLKTKNFRDDFKNKYLLLAVAIAVLCSLILVWFINNQDFFVPETTESKKFFENCKILSLSCLDNECPYYFLCGEKEIKDCQVYDCDSFYGVVIKDIYEKITTKEQPKPDEKKVQANLNMCRGTIEVLNKKYENSNLIVEAKVETNGDCQILSFLAQTQTGLQTAFFEEKENYYNLIFSSPPEEPFEVIAVAKGGISIREK